MINKNAVQIAKQKSTFDDLGQAITAEISVAVEQATDKRTKEI